MIEALVGAGIGGALLKVFQKVMLKLGKQAVADVEQEVKKDITK